MTSIYEFSAQQMNDKVLALHKFKGKPLLLVNTASQCGFTPQFAGLEELHQRYGKQGLVVLGFPCNQFGAQDPGSNEEIAGSKAIKWNFTKFLVGRDGTTIKRYAPTDTPESLTSDIAAALVK